MNMDSREDVLKPWHTFSVLGQKRPLLWIGLALLLFVEGQLLTDRFDVAALNSNPALWARLLAQSTLAFPCGIAIAGAVAFLARKELIDMLLDAAQYATGLRSGAMLVGHFALLYVFVGATQLLFGDSQPETKTAWLALTIWLASGVASLGALLLVAIQVRTLARFFGKSTGALLLGIGVGALAWLTGQATALEYWHPLGSVTLHSAHSILSLIVDDAVLNSDRFLIGTEGFCVRVGIGCSGYEGIGLTWIFISAYLWLYRSCLRFPHALLLLPIGTLIVWTTNIIRIVTLVLIGDRWSPELALGAFHTRAGWVLFCAVTLALIAAAQRARLFRRTPIESSALAPPSNPVLPWILPLTLVLAVRLGSGPFTDDGHGLASLAMLTGATCLWHFRAHYAAFNWKPSWPALATGVLVFLVWHAIAPSRPAAPTSGSPFVGHLGNAARFATSVIIVPIAEELAFRGYLLRRLIHIDFQRVPVGTWSFASFMGTSLLFGLAHEQWQLGIFAGMAYAGVLYHRRSLADAIVAHALTNALLFLIP